MKEDTSAKKSLWAPNSQRLSKHPSKLFNCRCDVHAIFHELIEQNVNFQYQQTSSEDKKKPYFGRVDMVKTSS